MVFDKDDDTGEDISHIYDKSAGTTTKMRRTGKTWKLDAIVAANFIKNSNPVFSRRG